MNMNVNAGAPVNTNNVNANAFVDEEEGSFGRIDFDKLLPILNKSLGWIILFILFSGAAGFLYLRWTPPIYESSSILKLEVKRQSIGDKAGVSQLEEGANLEGELEVIRSPVIYRNVIKRMPLDVTYNQQGKFLHTEMYKTSPFKVEYEVRKSVIQDKPIDLTVVSAQEFNMSFKIGGEEISQRLKFDRYYENEYFRFRISLTRFYNPDMNGAKYFYILNSASSLERYIAGGLKAIILNKNANTIIVSFSERTPEKAQDINNVVDTVYKEQTIRQRNLANEQTLNFLNDQLDSTQRKLEMTENQVESFIKSNRALDIKEKIGRTYALIETFKLKIKEESKQLEELNELKNLMVNNRQIGEFVPSISAIKDGRILAKIEDYNRAQKGLTIQRASTKRETKAGEILEKALETQRTEVLLLIDEYVKQTQSDIVEFEQQLAKFESESNSLPEQDSKMTQIKRFYNIHEKYYMLLIDNLIEFQIAKAGITPEFQILSPANLPVVPISPQKGSVYILWIVIGVIAGVVLVFVRYILQDTVVTIKEIEKHVAAPLLGVVPVYTKEKLKVARLVVDKNPKSSLSESLRAIRTNIDFVSNSQPGRLKRIISITSTVASEGKTFIALNLSGVLALSGYKVVMLDLDMRKPKLHLAFDIANDKGMSTILIGKHNFKECIYYSNVENIDIIPAGPTPPNPSELLMRPALDALFEELHKTYDLIVVDCPPVGLVTDGILIMQKADLPIYVVRSEYSKRVYLKHINKLVKVNGFTNLGVILNGLDKFKTYGYGYGYGYDYYTDDDVPQGFDLSWIKNLLGANG